VADLYQQLQGLTGITIATLRQRQKSNPSNDPVSIVVEMISHESRSSDEPEDDTAQAIEEEKLKKLSIDNANRLLAYEQKKRQWLNREIWLAEIKTLLHELRTKLIVIPKKIPGLDRATTQALTEGITHVLRIIPEDMDL